MRKTIEHYKFIVSRRNGNNLKYCSMDKNNRLSFFVSVPAINETDAYIKLRKFINKNFKEVDYDKDISVIDYRYARYAYNYENRQELTTKFHIDNNSYIEIKEKRKVIGSDKIIGLTKIIHKSLGELYLVNKDDINNVDKVVEFYIPESNGKFRKGKILYNRKFFKIKENR